MAAELFISYARKDAVRVLPLVGRLRAAGVSLWLDQAEIDGARLWRQEIAEAIAGARAALLMVSPAALTSPVVVQEITLAADEHKPILPLVLESTDFPPSLRLVTAGVHRLNLVNADGQDNLPAVLRALVGLGVFVQPGSTGAAATDTSGMDVALARLGLPPAIVPRSALTDDLQRRLRQGPLPVVCLQGLIGSGKTVLAGATARLMRESLPHLLVLRFDGPAATDPAYALEELNGFLAAHGKAIEPTSLWAQRPERILERLLGRMAGLPTLVILDGVEPVPPSWMELLLRGLTACKEVSTIVTARQRPTAMTPIQLIGVPPLSDAETRQFIEGCRQTLGLESIDVDALCRQLPTSVRSHPQALVTLMGQLRDLPLDWLIAAGAADEPAGVIHLVGEVLCSLSEPARHALALVGVLGSEDLPRAMQALRLKPPPALLAALPQLLGRSLIYRDGAAYIVPAVVAGALNHVDADALREATDEIADAWTAVLAGPEPSAPELRILAAVGGRVVHRLAEQHHWQRVAELTPEPVLELFNLRGHWKEYFLLLRLAHEATHHLGATAPRIALGLRMARKALQLGDVAAARTTLGAVEALIGSDPSPDRAELHSHRAMLYQKEGDHERAMDELRESRRLREAAGDPAALAIAEKLLGNLHLMRKEHDAARAAYERTLMLLGDRPDSKHAIEAEMGLGATALGQQRLAEAEAHLRCARELCQQHRYETGLPRVLFYLALTVEAASRGTEALALAREAAERASLYEPAVARLAGIVVARLEAQPRTQPPAEGQDRV